MLDQIIYTECIPQRDLLNNGKIIRKSGYGVYSLSQELFSGQKVNNYSRLYDLLVYNNCSKEKDTNINTFGSYLYTHATGNADAFLFDFGRVHCKNPLKERLHRSGIHIKQCLVGSFEDYPCRWMGASVWDAHLEHEDNYYMNEPANFEPPYLKELSSSLPEGAGVPFEMARAFVRSGRGKLFTAAVAFILDQLRRSETQQRVLLIRDIPKNVELWITAISYCIPMGLAKRITFNTNISNLNNKPDAKLFYPAGPVGEGVDIDTVPKIPFFLIAGYHPFDESCFQISQNADGQFCILDAEQETIEYEPKNLDNPYYRAVDEYSRELELFCGSVLTSSVSKPEEINVPELFDAYHYLMNNRENAVYDQTLFHLKNLTKSGLPAQQLTDQLLQNCLSLYPGFSGSDKNNNYPLLEIMTKMGKQCRRESEVSACISESIRSTLMGSGQGEASLTKNWKVMKDSVLSELMQPMLAEYINDYRLAQFLQTMPQASPDDVETMLDMMITMLHNQGHMAETIFSSQIKMSFFYQSVMMLLDDEERLMRILSKISHSEQLMDFLTYNVGVMLIHQSPEKAYHWFDILMDQYEMSSIKVCEWMCKFPQITIDSIEEFLAHRVDLQNRVDGTLITSLNNAMKALGNNEKTGIHFFMSASKTFTVHQSSNLMTLVQKCSITNTAAGKIFDMVDKRLLMYSFEPEIKDQVFEALSRWAKKLQKTPRSSLMSEFIKIYERAADSEARTLDAILRYASYRIVLSDEFIRSKYFTKLVEHSEKLLSGNVHFALLTMLDSEERSFISEVYVNQILERNSKINPDRQLIALGSAAVLPYKIPDVPEDYLELVRSSLRDAITEQLANYQVPGLDIKISKARDCDKSVKEFLLNILNPALAQKKSSGISKLFNRFGRE